MEDLRDLLDPLVEEAERRRVRQHEPRGALVHELAQLVHVQVPARVRADLLQLVAGHGHARRVRPVRRVGDEDRVARLALAAILEVGAYEHQAGQLALGSRRRLERDGVEPDDLGEDLLEAPHELHRALRAVLLLERMQVAEPGQRDDALVHSRVVLHRAGAERVEAGVDAERPVGERGEVADDLRLGELREARRVGAAQSSGELGNREPGVRQRRRAPARPGLLVDQLHGWLLWRTCCIWGTFA